ncbi:M48 family metalloprotease [Sinimarinibacterium thermocellulolyticum]|uniref:M48 family metalloprotease n=1 Tax=Sinimarinibacterium thermocellulolyticum TaxID=3170016 RepID=A0ABV2AB41_9GAMM
MSRLSCLAALPLAIVAGVLAQTDAPLPPSAIDLPHIGEPADNTLSPMQEKALGARVMGELYRGGYILEDPELTDYISAIGWKLAAHSATRAPELTFFMVKDNRINAFAMPGGYIGFNTGLLIAADTESEVAGVMGHELAHVTQRHLARTAADTEVANIATWLGVIAAIIAGSADPDVVMGALSLGQAMSYQRQVSYTRAHEHEADRIGIQTMAKAGYDPNGMASFFQKLGQQARLYGSGLPEILRTHPLTTNRIAEARARAAEMPAVEVKDPPEFGFMRARARVLSAERPSIAVNDFGASIAAGRDSDENRYGLAFALGETGQVERALEIMQTLDRRHPNQANVQLLHGRLLMLAGRHEQGLVTLERSLQRYPRYAPAILTYAEALMAAGRPDDARQVLLAHEQALGTQLHTFNLLARAARESGNMAEASYQMATFLHRRGDAGQALAQLDAGLRLPDLDDKQRARLLAKRREVRASLPDNWRPLDERDR